MTTNYFGILPAAGLSRRMGAPKLLLPWRGKALIEHVVGAWRASRVDEVIVVVSPENAALIDFCRRLPCRLVVPDAPPPDMKASVSHALKFISRQFSPADHAAWLVAPADLPGLRAEIINGVLAAYDPARPAIVVPTHGQRRGHPALFPWRLAADVLALSEAETLKDLMSRETVTEIPLADAAAFDDLDTPQDYLRLQDR